MSAVIRAVVFDYYGTLTPPFTVAAQRESFRELAVLLGVEPALFQAELRATAHDRFLGAGDSVEGMLAWAAARLGVRPEPEALARAAGRRRDMQRVLAQPRPEAKDVLSALRERSLRIGVISDCTAELPELFPDLPVAQLVDAAIYSCIVKRCKPDPANYLDCCRDLAVNPTDCLYVGDGDSQELPGARAVGMRAVWLAVPSEVGAVQYAPHEAWNGETITSLSGVLQLV